MGTADWQEDARFVGAFIRGGNWECGLRIARRVTVDKGTAHRVMASSGHERISIRDFSEEAGVSKTTIAKYLATWEWAADADHVDPSADLSPDDEYDFEALGLDQDKWAEFYQVACTNPPPWNPQGKPLEPRRTPERHVSKEQTAASPKPTREQITEAIKEDPEAAKAVVKEAIKADPEVHKAAREAVNEVHKERADAFRAKHADKAPQPKPDVAADYRDVGGGVLGEAITMLDVEIEKMEREAWVAAVLRVSKALDRNVVKGVKRFAYTTVPQEVAQIKEIQATLSETAFRFSDGFIPTGVHGEVC